MRQAIHILRKDALYLRREIILIVGLSALFVLVETRSQWEIDALITEPRRILIQVFLALAGIYTIVRVILAERLAGNTRFWVTRPYRWTSLLAAKVIFILTFVSLPILVARCLIPWILGFPTESWLSYVLLSHARLTFDAAIPVAVLAALTTGQGQFIFSAFGIFALLLLRTVVVPTNSDLPYAIILVLTALTILVITKGEGATRTISHNGRALAILVLMNLSILALNLTRPQTYVLAGLSIPVAVLALLAPNALSLAISELTLLAVWAISPIVPSSTLAIGAGAIFFTQYRDRQMLFSRVFALLSLAAFLLTLGSGEHFRFPGSGVVRSWFSESAPDTSAVRIVTDVKPEGLSWYTAGDSFAIYVPFAIRDIPAGFGAQGRSATVRLQAPDGTVWAVNKGYGSPTDSELRILVDKSFFNKVRGKAVTLTIAATLHLYRERSRTVQLGELPVNTLDGMRCSIHSSSHDLFCRAVAPKGTASVVVEARTETFRKLWNGGLFSPIWEFQVYAPFPSPSKATFVVRESVAAIERSLELQGVTVNETTAK